MVFEVFKIVIYKKYDGTPRPETTLQTLPTKKMIMITCKDDVDDDEPSLFLVLSMQNNALSDNNHLDVVIL